MPEERLSKLRKIRAEAQALLDERQIALQDEAKLPPLRKFAQFWIFVWRSFVRNRCLVRASSLAYTTLLALIPLLAVAISISTSLLKTEDGKKKIEQSINALVEKIAPQLGLTKSEGEGEADLSKTVQTIKSSIERINSGTLGATATIALLFVAISLLSTIENTLNDIWGVSRGRTWFTRVVLYWATITLGPILLLGATALNAGPYFAVTQKVLEKIPLIDVLRQFLPMVWLSLTFALFYQLMPNTKVQWRAAVIGGIVGGCLWHLNNSFSILYVGQVIRNKQLYGSLGLVPVFLIGIYFSWIILLFGAQAAYAFQNRRVYFQEKQAEGINQRGREFVALRLMTGVAQRFARGERPPTTAEIAEALAVPSRLVCKVISPLLSTHLLVEAVGEETGYLPARPLETISYQDILESMRSGDGEELATNDDPARATVREHYERIQDAERRIAMSITLASLAAGSGEEIKPTRAEPEIARA